MEIKALWVVTEASPISTLGDIVFKTDAVGLSNQFKGGLDPEQIVAFFDNEPEALHRGAQVIADRDEEARHKAALGSRLCGYQFQSKRTCDRAYGHVGVHMPGRKAAAR